MESVETFLISKNNSPNEPTLNKNGFGEMECVETFPISKNKTLNELTPNKTGETKTINSTCELDQLDQLDENYYLKLFQDNNEIDYFDADEFLNVIDQIIPEQTINPSDLGFDPDEFSLHFHT